MVGWFRERLKREEGTEKQVGVLETAWEGASAASGRKSVTDAVTVFTIMTKR